MVVYLVKIVATVTSKYNLTESTKNKINRALKGGRVRNDSAFSFLFVFLGNDQQPKNLTGESLQVSQTPPLNLSTMQS